MSLARAPPRRPAHRPHPVRQLEAIRHRPLAGPLAPVARGMRCRPRAQRRGVDVGRHIRHLHYGQPRVQPSVAVHANAERAALDDHNHAEGERLPRAEAVWPVPRRTQVKEVAPLLLPQLRAADAPLRHDQPRLAFDPLEYRPPHAVSPLKVEVRPCEVAGPIVRRGQRARDGEQLLLLRVWHLLRRVEGAGPQQVLHLQVGLHAAGQRSAVEIDTERQAVHARVVGVRRPPAAQARMGDDAPHQRR
mmetsp:Transcript_39010/g.126103  ORF Transcript_39010/g.126103 Transcript_39010/m.126103 type:complete len:247 (+) Transcript_39010:45-785(+)